MDNTQLTEAIIAIILEEVNGLFTEGGIIAFKSE